MTTLALVGHHPMLEDPKRFGDVLEATLRTIAK